MNITEHFSLEELTHTSTGLDNTPTIEQITNLKALANTVLEPLRIAYGKPIYVNSGFRSEAVNNKVGGSKTSQHLLGQAADIACENNQLLWDTALKLIDNGTITVGQLINEKKLSWIHISLPTLHINNQIKSIL
jgi:uncharacterized protein YcbK (DUF882 family)